MVFVYCCFPRVQCGVGFQRAIRGSKQGTSPPTSTLMEDTEVAQLNEVGLQRLKFMSLTLLSVPDKMLGYSFQNSRRIEIMGCIWNYYCKITMINILMA